MQVKIKRLHPDAKIPQKAHQGDAGFDLVAVTKELTPQGYIEMKTGLGFEIPPGHMGLLFPRSSISNTKMTLTNSVGVLDENFRGDVSFRFKPATSGKGGYEIGDKIGQLVIMPYPSIELVEVDELDETDRGTGSYGSSGK